MMKKNTFIRFEKRKDIDQLKKSCQNLFSLASCHEKQYVPYQTSSFNLTKIISVHSNHFTRVDSGVVLLNKHEMISNILTRFNVWLGLSLPKLLKNFILKIGKKNFFLSLPLNKKLIFGKILNLLFNLALISGLSYNLYSLSSEILKQNKIASVEYKFLTKVEFPIVTICVDYKEKFNFTKKMKVNGNLLDKMTYSANDIFESINYLDDNQQMQTQVKFNNNRSKLTNRVLEMSHFYFMKFKCFKAKYKSKLPFYFFYKNQNNTNYFVINLKSNINSYFLNLEAKNTFNFGHFKKLSKGKNILYFIKTTIHYKDSYTFLKEIPSLFEKDNSVNFNEAKSYSNFLKKKFKDHKNLSTLLLPLTKKYFHLTINNTEFQKFYKSKMGKLEKKNINNSYSADYFFSTLLLSIKPNKNILKLKSKLVEVETIIEDKIPVENFFLAVLNIISFWLNLSLTDIVYRLLKIIKLKNFFS